jgi:hypothetical protein
VAGGGQGGFGVGEFDQACFPSGFQAAGHETVLRFAGGVRAFGAFGGVAGAFDAQLDGAQRAGPAVGDLAGGGQGQGEVFGGDRGEQLGGDHVVDGGGAYRVAVGGGHVVGAGSGAFVVGLPAGVTGTHRPPARTTNHDALTQCGTFPRWAGTGVGGVAGELGLVSQEARPADVAPVVVLDAYRPLGPG